MIELKNINDSNLGGLNVLRFAPRHYFSNLNPTNLTFKQGFDWINIKLTSETGQIEHEGALDNGDPYYNVSLEIQLPKERSEIDTHLNRHIGLPCVVMITDNNRNTRLTGHHPGEFVLLHTSTSGQKVADENGYTISFKGKQQYKADFITL